MIGSAKSTPLDAEIRQTEPAIALVMIGHLEVGQQNPGLFQTNLTLVAQDLLAQGVIPVLSTIPEDFLPWPGLSALTAQFNQIIANVAGNLNVPLWNLWVGLQGLPNEGIGPDGLHLSYSPAGAELLDNADLVFGMNYRNLTTLGVLAKIVGVVERNGAPDPPPPSVPVVPFVATLYQEILQRPVDAGGLANFSAELYQGVAPSVVIQQIWTSAEHRQIQIGRYYQRFFHRPADAAGFGWWQQQFSQGMNETQVQVAMLASPEYGQLHPGGPRFVEAVYGDVLGRLPGPSDGIYWLIQMQNAGLTRDGFASRIVQSTEAEAALVDRFYDTFLGGGRSSGWPSAELLAGDQGGQPAPGKCAAVREFSSGWIEGCSEWSSGLDSSAPRYREGEAPVSLKTPGQEATRTRATKRPPNKLPDGPAVGQDPTTFELSVIMRTPPVRSVRRDHRSGIIRSRAAARAAAGG